MLLSARTSGSPAFSLRPRTRPWRPSNKLVMVGTDSEGLQREGGPGRTADRMKSEMPCGMQPTRRQGRHREGQCSGSHCFGRDGRRRSARTDRGGLGALVLCAWLYYRELCLRTENYGAKRFNDMSETRTPPLPPAHSRRGRMLTSRISLFRSAQRESPMGVCVSLSQVVGRTWLLSTWKPASFIAVGASRSSTVRPCVSFGRVVASMVLFGGCCWPLRVCTAFARPAK